MDYRGTAVRTGNSFSSYTLSSVGVVFRVRGDVMEKTDKRMTERTLTVTDFFGFYIYTQLKATVIDLHFYLLELELLPSIQRTRGGSLPGFRTFL